MKKPSRWSLLALLMGGLVLLSFPSTAWAFIEAPHSFGQVISLSTNILIVRVEKVDKEKNLIIYKKVEDLKGKHPADVIRHNIGKVKLQNDREWQVTMQWAEPGKIAVMFHNGGAAETCIGNYWYQTGNAGEWWNQVHGEPYLCRTYCGSIEKLIAAVKDVQNGKEVLVSCMQGSKENSEKERLDLALGKGRMWRLKASMKLLDYDSKRDFAGWGGEDFRRVQGMPGFTHISALGRVDPEAQGISALDIDGNGKADLCLFGGGKVMPLQNGGESLNELSLPNLATGARAAVWADYNGDGKPDLLLATPLGPKLYTNMGKGVFRDDSHLLPPEAAYNLTSAAWIDYDGDGKPDILLGNGFHGLRMYRNKGAASNKPALAVGKWHYIGPFPNAGGTGGFDTAYPPEKEIDLTKKYPGKNNEEAVWKEGNFTDGQVNNLALFKPENNTEAIVYLYREIECARPMEMPVSLGRDDTLTVWLNGEKLVSQNVQRGAAPDQALATLKLKEGKNAFLMKIGQGGGEWGFYFASKIPVPPTITWEFEDVSTAVGFGPDGIGSTVKGDTLSVCDVNGDGRPDILYGAGTGMLLLNTPKGFVEAKDSGISYKPGKIGPVFGDFLNTGHPGLFVPQNGTCKLFKNDGQGHFTDVTAQAGDLAKPVGQATSAAWGDLFNDGHLSLVVGCLRGSNRVYRNKGDGTFLDMTTEVGLDQKVFNSQGVAFVDLNNDGILDMVFSNEGQESVVLLSNPQFFGGKRTPVILAVAGNGVIGSRVRILGPEDKFIASRDISGGDGRGGQAPPHARFTLAPGNYKVEVRYSSGVTRTRDITVAGTPLRAVIDEK